MNPLDIEANHLMLDFADGLREAFNSGLEFDEFPFILSAAAETFIKDNGLGTFTLRWNDDASWIIITAPDKYAATIFRLAF